MVSKCLTIMNEEGFHIRTAAALAGAMAEYPCNVYIIFNGNEYNAKSTLNLVTACIKCGNDFELVCDGEREAEALEAAVDLIQSGLSV